MIAILILVGLLAVVLSIASNSSKNRESMQKMERAMAAQLPPPAGFDDCTPEMIAAIREGNRLGAILLYTKLHNGADKGAVLKRAQERIDALRVALLRGPEIGRPPASIIEQVQGKVGPS